MGGKAWLDVSIVRCPRCGWFFADASWYVIELGADVECGRCHETFNTKKCFTDRVMLEFSICEKGEVLGVEMIEDP